ncbi:MAG: cellulase family glycosylhydrolase, partial [Chloroflexi bacterium]|nr:cellulase family glycosylhydrolase [Chloroflexota bacterium]
MNEKPGILKSLEQVLEGPGRRHLVVDLVIIPLLLLLVLLAPPISLWSRLNPDIGGQTITAQGGTVFEGDGTQLTIPPDTLKGDVQVALHSTPQIDFLAQSTGDDETSRANRAIPPYLRLTSPYYQFQTRGQEVNQAVLVIPVPTGAEPWDTLDLYGWDGQSWRFVPSNLTYQEAYQDAQVIADLTWLPQAVGVMQTRSRGFAVSAWLPTDEYMDQLSGDILVEMNPQGLTLQGDGAIGGQPQRGWTTDSRFIVVPSISNVDAEGVVRIDLLNNVLIDEESRNRHIAAIVDLVQTNMYAGIDIRYRGLAQDAGLREDLTRFMTDLAAALHQEYKLVSITVETPTQVSADMWDTGSYDWAALGQVVDIFKLEGVQNPATYNAQMPDLLRYATRNVSRTKLQLVVSTYSIDELAGGQETTLRPYKDVLHIATQVEVLEPQETYYPGDTVRFAMPYLAASDGQLAMDEQTGMIKFVYEGEDNAAHVVWLENANSIAKKLGLVERFNLRGVAVRNLLSDKNDSHIWTVMSVFRETMVAKVPEAAPIQVAWDINGNQVPGADGPSMNWKVEETGNYTVTGSLVNGVGKVSSNVTVQVVEKPTPTPTPTPIPPTPTPKPAGPAPTAKPSGGGGTVPAPKTFPGFAYGFCAHMYGVDMGATIGKVKGAGFNWVKIQVPWKDFEGAPGQINFGGLDPVVDACASTGTKLFMSVVKAPMWARPNFEDKGHDGMPGDAAAFGNFMAALAVRYKGRVQAYEVWNEQNLGTETGKKPSVDRYMPLLKVAYSRIKAADPGALVISGALTPVGYSDYVNAIDDVEFMKGMKNA